MSYLRAKSRAINQNVYLDNKLTTFTKPPMLYGNLFVDNYERVGGGFPQQHTTFYCFQLLD